MLRYPPRRRTEERKPTPMEQRKPILYAFKAAAWPPRSRIAPPIASQNRIFRARFSSVEQREPITV